MLGTALGGNFPDNPSTLSTVCPPVTQMKSLYPREQTALRATAARAGVSSQVAR